ncbi:putative sulfoacetate transporter SauU [Corynebacterium guangdongense]|nr:putative sulfoacetate transporter SauU [Corynebacterium guangdongense]
MSSVGVTHMQRPPLDFRGYAAIAMAVLLSFAYGLQMYATVPAFGILQEEFSLDLTQIGLLVSIWFLGYAVAHVPAGFAAAAWGIKRVAVWGAFALAVSTFLFVVADGYPMMVISRLLGGLAMSFMAGAAFPLATAWAPPKHARLVVGGLVNGVGFTGGSALGLYLWTILIDSYGWRQATLVAAVVSLVIAVAAVFFVSTPDFLGGLDGGHFTWKSTGEVFRSRSIWAIGIGSICGYGALFTVSQLGPGYVEAQFGFSASSAGLLGALMLLLGIPAALISGVIADRASSFLPTLWIPAGLLVVMLLVLPFIEGSLLWVALPLIGILGSMYFSPATVAHAEYPGEISPQNYSTAFGLVLSLGNVGAFLFPYIYSVSVGYVGPRWGWMVLGVISAVAWFGFFFATEPRGPRGGTSVRIVESAAAETATPSSAR